MTVTAGTISPRFRARAGNDFCQNTAFGAFAALHGALDGLEGPHSNRADISLKMCTFESLNIQIMILTTTPSIEGRTIAEYKGVVFGEVISGVNFLRDFAASIRNIVGGRSGSYEEELIKARNQAMEEMCSRARSLGADAVVGIDIDYEVLGEGGGMLMVTASGTAVKLA